MLAWLVAGAIAWYAGERAEDGSGWAREPMTMGQPPPRVREDAAAWRESCDLLFSYISEHLAWEHEAHVITDELGAAFNEWVTGRGHREWSAEKFTARWEVHSEVREHGVSKIRPRRGKHPGLSRRPGGRVAGDPGPLPGAVWGQIQES